MQTDERKGTERLRHAGLRVTAPRLAVLMAVQGDNRHVEVRVIAEVARKRLETISTQAVYDNLNLLVAAGLIRQIQLPGQVARYEARVNDNHHHLVCRRCGESTDMDCVIGAAPCLEPSDNYGFLIDEAEVTYWGICAFCQQQDPTDQKEDQPS